jgi:hypothetical protein
MKVSESARPVSDYISQGRWKIRAIVRTFDENSDLTTIINRYALLAIQGVYSIGNYHPSLLSILDGDRTLN